MVLSRAFFLILLALFFISSPSIASLSTVSIARTAIETVVCALLHRRSDNRYDLNCTGVGSRLQRTYSSSALSSSAIAGGDGFLCLLGLTAADNSTVICWDLNNNVSSSLLLPRYKAADISAGGSQACVGEGGVRGRVKCWRGNQLSLTESLSFSTISISVGGEFVCGLLLDSRKIRCFGTDAGIVGGEPPGSYLTISAGSRHACAVSTVGKLVCWGTGKPEPEVGEVPFEISSLALGENKTCALGSNGAVACWGMNSMLPESLADALFMAIHAKGSAICGVLMANYSLACWGSSIFLPNPFVFDRVLPGTCVPVASCSCGLLSDSGSWCANASGICRLCEIEAAAKPSASTPPAGLPPPPSPPYGAGTSKRRTAYIVIGSVGFVIGFATLFLFVIIRSRQHKDRIHDEGQSLGVREFPHPPPQRQLTSLLSNGRGPTIEEFPLPLLLAATESFSESHKIGSGSFGSVYGATLPDRRQVAIKRAETPASTSATAAAAEAAEQKRRLDKESAFLSEIGLLSRVNHKNLVRLLGYCDQGAERVLVYEFMANGTLHDHLHGRSGGAGLASWDARLRAALDAARGLEYLHAYAVPPIIHRDIKSSNILLDEMWTAKVSDFGLSLLNPAKVSEFGLSDVGLEEDGWGCCRGVRAAGTLGYMDPEYYRLQQLTSKSDVYSFGVVLLELLTGCKAIHRFEHSGTPKNVVDLAAPHIAVDNVHKVLDPKLPPPTPDEIEAVAYVAYLAIDCVSPEGRERPTMTEVVCGLERAVAACSCSVEATASPLSLSMSSPGRSR